MQRSAREASWRLLAALALIIPCAGCSSLYWDRRETVSLHAGDAVHTNKVAQMVDPWPAAAADRNIDGNGDRMQRAGERYRTNRTTPLHTTSTSSVQYQPILAPVAAGGGSGTNP